MMGVFFLLVSFGMSLVCSWTGLRSCDMVHSEVPLHHSSLPLLIFPHSLHSPEKLRQSLPLPAVLPLPTTAGAAARDGDEQEAVMERAEGEHLGLWDHTSKSRFKISVDDRQFRDTWQFYHSRAHCNFTAYIVHVLAFYWCLSASPSICRSYLNAVICVTKLLCSHSICPIPSHTENPVRKNAIYLSHLPRNTAKDCMF